MAKKEKLGIDKIISRLNKEFEKTSSQIERLIKDALKQIESIQTQIQEPVKKLKDDIEKVRERELNRFHSEFDKKIDEFNKLQSNILEKLGIQATKEQSAPTKKAAPVKAPTAKAKPAAKKPAVKKATATKVVNDADLAKLKGVGPALQKKMNAAGITSLKQIASPSASDAKLLDDFASVKGFDTWKADATAFLG